MLAAAMLAAGVVMPVAGAASGHGDRWRPPPIKHVFLIVLENKGYAETFRRNSPAPYIARTLRHKGKLLTHYYATGHVSLDNYIAMVSGQPPNAHTQSDCQIYSDFVGALGPDGVAVGQGCVYPKSVRTVADQLDRAGLRWRGYMQDMGKNRTRDHGRTCAHPTIGTRDGTQSATAHDQYATRHNPFVYFHSIIGRRSCHRNDVPLGRLRTDLQHRRTTPNLAFITPNLCNDGHDGSGTKTGQKCANGNRGGLYQSGVFLSHWVPRILQSPAYADGGMVVVTWDEAESGQDASACCNEPTGPNTPAPGINGPGGGRIGAIVVSRYVRAGTTSDRAYNHYSLLRTIENLFGLPHLGEAAATGLRPFGRDVFDRTP